MDNNEGCRLAAFRFVCNDKVVKGDSLSSDNKLELIARLSYSMKIRQQTKDNSWKALFGAFMTDQSADEFFKELKDDGNL